MTQHMASGNNWAAKLIVAAALTGLATALWAMGYEQLRDIKDAIAAVDGRLIRHQQAMEKMQVELGEQRSEDMRLGMQLKALQEGRTGH
jgi:septal ring factor EnvC (AmiA/AmiB activator)